MKKELLSRSEEETFNWARELGSKAGQGSVFALSGELGTGKTIIAKGIAKGIGIDDEITSPTFLMMEIYEGRFKLYHFDLYRLENIDELNELNFEEYWYGDGVSIIEWAERADERIPADAIRITLQWAGNSERRISIEYPCN